MPARRSSSNRESSARKERARPTALVCAVNYLARSLVPESKLRAYLTRKGYESAEIDESVERLKSEGYLDERRMAESRVGVLTEKRGYWGRALEGKLRQDGFSEETSEAAREVVRERYQPVELALAALARRYGEHWWETPERRMASWLERHGFPSPVIVELLRKRRKLAAASAPEERP